MNVITGTAKGKRLLTVEGRETVRPTSQRIKESIFSIIQFDLPGATVLDLFCGSGQMGIEALSRGAKSCHFIDNNKKSIEIAKKNLESTQLSKQANIVLMDYISFLSSTNEKFDIAFLDPPYNNEILPKALELISDKMAESGIVLCEHEKHEQVPNEFNGFKLHKQYIYGRICVSSYKPL